MRKLLNKGVILLSVIMLALGMSALTSYRAQQAGKQPEVGGLVFSPQTAHGMMEFYKSGEFAVPLGVNNIYIQLWGAGGGGGGLPFADVSCASGSWFPGAGGGGAYTASALTVTEEDSSFDIVVGFGGAAFQGGGESSISLTSQHGTAGTILYAGGGYSGSTDTNGAGGLYDSRGMVSHPGFPGTGGGCGGSSVGEAWNYNLLPNQGWLQGPNQAYASLGQGGWGDYAGGNGYVYITW